MSSVDIELRKVQSQSDLKAFIGVPRDIYAGMPGFQARLDLEQKGMLDKKHAAFFEHGRADFWVALRNGRPVGRISAQVDDLVAEYQPEPFGMFGCFDAVDDEAVTSALLSTAENWLVEQGQSKAQGPYFLSVNGETGLLIDGQTSPAMTLLNWAPDYLVGHLETAGYGEVKRLYTYKLSLGDQREQEHAAKLRRRREVGDLSLRPLDTRRIARDGELLRLIYNDAWAGNWGFLPITETEMKQTVKELGPILSKECAVFAELDGETVACALFIPNLFEITHDLDGRLMPFNWIKFLYRAMTMPYRSGRIILLGVKRKLHSSLLGATLPFLMVDELVQASRRKGRVTEIEMGWVLEDNKSVRALIEKVGGEIEKTFAIFEKQLV